MTVKCLWEYRIYKKVFLNNILWALLKEWSGMPVANSRGEGHFLSVTILSRLVSHYLLT